MVEAGSASAGWAPCRKNDITAQAPAPTTEQQDGDDRDDPRRTTAPARRAAPRAGGLGSGSGQPPPGSRYSGVPDGRLVVGHAVFSP